MATKAKKKVTQLKLVPRVESGMKDIEKTIQQVVEQVAELTSQSIYFGLGATVLLKEGCVGFVEKAIQRGESSGEDVLKRAKSRFKFEPKAKKADRTIESRIETGVRKVFDTLDIPSKSDVQKLSRRVAELSGRVKKLAQVQKG